MTSQGALSLEPVELVADHVERVDEHVRAAQLIVGRHSPTSTSRLARAGRHLNAAQAALLSALVVAGRRPAGAALVDVGPKPTERDEVLARAAAGDAAADSTRASTDRAAAALLRVALNLDDVEAAALLELVDHELNVAELEVDVHVLDRIRRRLAPRVARARAARASS